MKVKVTLVDSVNGARVISDRKNVESVNHPKNATFEVEGEIIELRELGLNPDRKRDEEAPGEGGDAAP